jgi:molybdate transport system regulatory protein
MKRARLIRFRIDFTEYSNLGPGKVALLEGIRAYRSVSEAARQMGMSYRRAWLLLDSVNKTFDVPATVNSAGGRGGGGAEITPFGVLLIERYREVERKLNAVADECLKEISKRIIVRSTSRAARKVPVTKKQRKRK